jgi:hypothetical protein
MYLNAKASINRQLTAVALVAGITPICAQAALNELPGTELLPVVPGDTATRSTPFLAWFQDLTLDGYVEEEYSVSGRADIYAYSDDGSQSPVVFVDEAQVPYETRILVRRPEDPGQFNGTVYYEVLNATAGWDGDPIWQSNYPYFIREGAVWVGMSTKPVTVDFLRDGWAGFGRNASRYETLAMPRFGQVWDMLAQTGLLLKTPDAAGNPLAGYDVERIIMVGYSQSAAYQVTFANSFHEAAVTPDGSPTIDAYFISAGGDNAKHVTGPTDTTPEELPSGDARNLLLTDVPTIRFQTQTEVVNFPSYPVRQSEADSPWLRFYEMAGGSHVDAQINEVGGQALVRDLDLPPSFCPEPTGGDYNPIVIGYVQSALMHGLDRWITDGNEPPASRFMELVEPVDDPELSLDEDGNAKGGIRPPQLEVPLGTYVGTNSGPGFCFLFGGFTPFDDARLMQLYPNRGRYISRIFRAIKRSQREGFLLPEDAIELRREARRSDVGLR